MKRRAVEDEQRRIEDEELAVISPTMSTTQRMPRVAQNSVSSHKIVKKEAEVISLVHVYSTICNADALLLQTHRKLNSPS